jgi:hypothetical protein
VLSGVDFKVPVIIRSVVFNCASILFTCALFLQTGQQYPAVKYTRASPATHRVCAFAPQLVPASLCIMLFLVFNFCRNFSMCCLKVRDESRVTPIIYIYIVYFFLVGACVRIYKILQRNATFLLVTLFFYLH